VEGYEAIVFEITHKVEKFKQCGNVSPDALLLGRHQDHFLTAYINDSEMNTCDGPIGTVHNAEFQGLKIRVIDREDDLLEVAITNWRSL